MSKHKQHFLSLRRLFAALRVSLAGLRCVFSQEAAFRLEVVIVLILLPVACFADITSAGRALLILTLLLVPFAELVNSAIEAAVDWTAQQQPPENRRDPLAAKAKDAASAAVLFAVIIAAAVWLIILFGG